MRALTLFSRPCCHLCQEAAAELAALCAHLPLALRIAAANLVSAPFEEEDALCLNDSPVYA